MPESQPTDSGHWTLGMLDTVNYLRKSLQSIALRGCHADLPICRERECGWIWCDACIAEDALENLGTVLRPDVQPRACDIEIVERAHRIDGTYGLVVPNDIRINGRSVLAPADKPVIVHSIEIGAHEPVLVTLTLFARIVSVHQEAKTDA